MRHLLLATRNAHKTREFSEILGRDFTVRDLSGQRELPPIEETGSTFAENAILKAVATSRHFGGLVVADDSGLEVDALNGAPGVFSARYAGPNATDQENVAHLLGELRRRETQPPFTARFRCALALAQGGEVFGTFDGKVEGRILSTPRGSHGFGYDPVFQPSGFDRTLAEFLPEEKNRISHRSRAIRSLRQALPR